MTHERQAERGPWRGEAADFSPTAVEVAPRLLGAFISVRDRQGEVTVRLTEVEAYAGERDPGSHAYRGRTPRTEPMFGAGGRLYVYFSYGMHWCANLVCGSAGQAGGVLLRAGEVVGGLEVARARRLTARRDADLARGPARLAAALGLTGADSGLELAVDGRAWVSAPAGGNRAGAQQVSRQGPRVGVAGEGGDGELFPWRWWIDGDPTVSPYRPAVSRRSR